MTSKDLFEDIDKIAKKSISKIKKELESLEITSFDFKVILDDDKLKKYELNSDITIIMHVGANEIKTQYYYKGIKLEPVNYYLRPKDYHEVSTLTILQECIIQDTFKPDIMFLERGEKR